MKLVGLMPVRNEDWVLGLSARVALQWCDYLVVFLHSCCDRSHDIMMGILGEQPGRVGMFSGAGEWVEMEHRQRMLEVARKHGATHIAMIDADEVLTANLLCPIGGVRTIRGATNHQPIIRDYIEVLAPRQMLELPGYNLRGSLDRYHSNGIWGNRWFSVAFKDTPEAHWAGDKFHSRNPAGLQWRNWRPIGQGEGGVLHLWGASERRLRAKHAMYKVTERLRFPAKPTREIEQMYNLWRSKNDELISYPKQWPNDWEYADVPSAWWAHGCFPKASDEVLRMCDANDALEPWQEVEVRRLVSEHGREKFQGLDLFGVA